MNKQEYIATALENLTSLFGDETFRRQLFQVRARAIQSELLAEPPQVEFTFNSDQIWRYCDYISSECGLLLREGQGDKVQLLIWLRVPARAFEFLSRFAKKEDKEILLLHAAICYHIAGYQANAQCLSNVYEKNTY